MVKARLYGALIGLSMLLAGAVVVLVAGYVDLRWPADAMLLTCGGSTMELGIGTLTIAAVQQLKRPKENRLG